MCVSVGAWVHVCVCAWACCACVWVCVCVSITLLYVIPMDSSLKNPEPYLVPTTFRHHIIIWASWLLQQLSHGNCMWACVKWWVLGIIVSNNYIVEFIVYVHWEETDVTTSHRQLSCDRATNSPGVCLVQRESYTDPLTFLTGGVGKKS